MNEVIKVKLLGLGWKHVILYYYFFPGKKVNTCNTEINALYTQTYSKQFILESSKSY